MAAWRTAPAPSMTQASPGTCTPGTSGGNPQEGGEGGYALAGKVEKAGMWVSDNVSFVKNGLNRQILDGKGRGKLENIQQNNVRQSVKNFEKKLNSGGK